MYNFRTDYFLNWLICLARQEIAGKKAPPTKIIINETKRNETPGGILVWFFQIVDIGITYQEIG